MAASWPPSPFLWFPRVLLEPSAILSRNGHAQWAVWNSGGPLVDELWGLTQLLGDPLPFISNLSEISVTVVKEKGAIELQSTSAPF